LFSQPTGRLELYQAIEPIVVAAIKPTTYTTVADTGKWGWFCTVSAAACINNSLLYLPCWKPLLLNRIKKKPHVSSSLIPVQFRAGDRAQILGDNGALQAHLQQAQPVRCAEQKEAQSQQVAG